MKKTVFIMITLMFPAACGTLKTVTVDRLQMGMTRKEE